ncbi:hypothetical protein MNBD_ALPHA12-1605 [hydrothermal vent metagenome]|uniref:Uncharacterized protein n=1 Tax=hydrothermal vent metagenome TaxID=652676 RepID=A0A3B0UB91_9ZZZZ
MTRFATCLELILSLEGGYVDHKSDPGGSTNMGITRKTLARWRRVSPWWKLARGEVKSLKKSEAAAIYKAFYWDRCNCSALGAGLDLALFDFALNSGPVRAIRTLQALVGVARDGIVGPLTLAAIDKKTARLGLATIIERLFNSRLSFLRRLNNFSVFGRGWQKRLRTVRSRALIMAGQENKRMKPRRNIMNILSGYKTYIVALAMLIAGLGQVLGVDLPGFDQQSAGQLIFQALAVLFLRRGIKGDVFKA